MGERPGMDWREWTLLAPARRAFARDARAGCLAFVFMVVCVVAVMAAIGLSEF